MHVNCDWFEAHGNSVQSLYGAMFEKESYPRLIVYLRKEVCKLRQHEEL